MGGQVWVVHVAVLGDWLAACLAARFASVAASARGVGVALGSGGPTLFVFLRWGACARVRAEGGRARVSGLWHASAWALRGVWCAGFWVRERGRVSCGAGARPSAWWGGAGECGRAFACVRAGRGSRGARDRAGVWCTRTWRVGDTRTRVVGGYAYPVGLAPVFGDSLCGF